MNRPRHIMTRRGNRAGFTLIEVILSTVTVAILMGAMSSVTLLMMRCLNSSAGDIGESADVAEHIAADISLAESFSEQTATAVTMVVPDRDGDDLPETIRYSWSGTAGDSLMRTYNGGTPAVMVENVHHFDLDYIMRTVGGS